MLIVREVLWRGIIEPDEGRNTLITGIGSLLRTEMGSAFLLRFQSVHSRCNRLAALGMFYMSVLHGNPKIGLIWHNLALEHMARLERKTLWSAIERHKRRRSQKPVPYQHASSSLASGTIMIENKL